MSDLFRVIQEAILKKQQVVANYHGHTRYLCPHVLGYKRGRAQCLFYQFGGTSDSPLGGIGSPDNWRCIPLDGLTDVSVHDGEWHTAPTHHSHGQTCVGQVVAVVGQTGIHIERVAS
jgi:hypothetical protein